MKNFQQTAPKANLNVIAKAPVSDWDNDKEMSDNSWILSKGEKKKGTGPHRFTPTPITLFAQVKPANQSVYNFSFGKIAVFRLRSTWSW